MSNLTELITVTNELHEEGRRLTTINAGLVETLKLVATQYVTTGTFNLEAIETALAQAEASRPDDDEPTVPNSLAEVLFDGAVGPRKR